MTDENESVWVAITVIPGKKAGHVEAFSNEQAAEEYEQYSEENTPEGVTSWIVKGETEVKDEFEPCQRN